MAAWFAPPPFAPRLCAMASIAARRRRRHGPRHQVLRFLDEPMLLRRTRRDLAELAALVWLAAEVVEFVRSRRGRP
jgi:hypothetical protein